jgi:glycosyltransferase involved in cell wall biosynthesis
MKLCFWWSIVSQHQSAYVRELARSNDVVVVAERHISEDREQLGWGVPDLGNARIIVDPTDSQMRELLRESDERIHVLQGWRGCRLCRRVLSRRNRPARFGVVVEACDERGTRGFIRTLYYRALLASRNGKADFVFSMGSMGEGYYRKCGIQSDSLFPFCYTVDRSGLTAKPAVHGHTESTVRVLYIGQLCKRKGVDLLLRGLHANYDQGWQGEVIGDGPQMEELRRLCTSLKMEGRVHFRGTMAHISAMERLSASDLLVLPSRHDGWGAVVNEALMLGVPVICTDRCGAWDLIRAPWLGSVVRAGSVSSLADALGLWIGRGKKTRMQSEYMKDWSACIEGPAIASYFASVLEHVYHDAPRPVAPWRTELAASMRAHDARAKDQHCQVDC